MKRVFKIILIILIILIGASSLVIFADEIITVHDIELIFIDGLSILLLPAFIILSIPATLFNIKTLHFYKQKHQKSVMPLDSDMVTNENSLQINEISRFMWIGNLLLGISILVSAWLVLEIVLSNYENINSLLDIRYLIVGCTFAIGLWILVEEWNIYKAIKAFRSQTPKNT